MIYDMFQNDCVIDQIEAYLLGFIYADGTILFDSSNRARYNTMKIDLAIKDEGFLLMLNDYLNGHISYHSVYLNGNEYKQVRLAIYNTSLVNRLIDLGISHNKTYEECSYVFTNVPDHLKWHFIRGFFDGDGSVTFNGRGQGEFMLCSHNKTLLMALHDFMSKYIPTNSNVVIGDGVWRIRYDGNRQLSRLCDLLYRNSILKLDRKYALVKQATLLIHKSSKYKHVKYQPHCEKPYSVWFMVDGVQRTLGRFDTERDALDFYNSMCTTYNLKPQYDLFDEWED